MMVCDEEYPGAVASAVHRVQVWDLSLGFLELERRPVGIPGAVADTVLPCEARIEPA